MNRPTPVVFEMQVLLVNLFHAYVDRVLVSLPVSWNVVEAFNGGGLTMIGVINVVHWCD